MQIYKFPLDPPTLSSYTFASDTTNNLAGASGMAKNGVPIYPYNNDQGQSVWQNCEADYCNAHAGKGEDYHYHGDPFGSKCIYDEDDYSGDHPPKIGMGADGYPIYGRHIEDDMDGASTNLDSCNGHSHGDYGYHYHASQNTVSKTLVGEKSASEFTEYRVGPTVCWGGRIGDIPNFWAPDVEDKGDTK